MKNLIYIIICFAFTVEVNAQDYEYEVNENLFIQSKFTSPSSPEVGSLGKYGDYQVSTFTGGLSLSVPVVGMSDRVVGYQMNLNYDGSGNKVENLPSWAGLGWSLSGVPLISRSVKGKPDYHGNYFSKSSIIEENLIVNNDLYELYEFYKDVELGEVETIPDEYNLSFPGGSAKFFISHKKQVVLTEQSDIKIVPSYPTSGGQNDEVSGFTVFDPQGNTYVFNITERTHITENDDESSNNETYEYISAFYCSSITSAKNSDQIIFSYDTEQEEFFNDINNEKHIVKKYPSGSGSAQCQPCQSTGVYLSAPFEERLRDRRFLSEVKYFLGGNLVEKIVINSTSNKAVYKRPFDRKIENIEYYSGNMSTPKYTVEFNTNDTQNRLMLEGIQTIGHDGTKSNKYAFENDPTQLPKASSSSIDAWGYYNNNPDNGSLIPTVNGVGDSAKRNPYLPRTKAGVLLKITYPTGGSTEFEYELNKGRYKSEPLKEVGGLRVKSVSTVDLSSDKIITKEYKYIDDLGNDNGIIFQNISFQKSETFSFYKPSAWGSTPTSCDNYTCSFYKNYSTNTSTTSYFNGTHIAYPRVEERLSDASSNYGKNVYYYYTTYDGANMDNPQTGNLLKKQVFDKDDQIVQETINNYDHITDPVGVFYSYSVVPHSYQDNKKYLCYSSSGYEWTQNPSVPICPNYNTKYKHADQKSIKTHINVITSTVQKDYFHENGQSQVVSKYTSYTYDNDFDIILPKKVTVTDDNGYSKEFETDYSGLSSSGIGFQMKANYILYEKLGIKVNNGSGGGVKTDFINQNGKYIPKTISQLREDGSLKFKAEITEYQDHFLPKKITLNTQTNINIYDYYSGSKTGLLLNTKYGARQNDYTWSDYRELLSVSDFNDILSTYTYDGIGRLKTSLLQNGRINSINIYNQAHSNGGENYISSRVSYPLDSNIPLIVYQSTFDGIGRKLEDRKLGFTQSGGDYTTSNKYNALGSVISATDPGSGGTTENTYEFSPLQRMESSTPPGSPNPILTGFNTNTEVIGGYAPNTLYKTSSTDENGLVAVTYTDIFGRQIATVTDETGLKLTTVYTYNDRDQILTIQPPGGGEQYNYTYYPDGLLQSKTIPDKGTHTYTYNDQDQIETEALPNGKTLAYLYDPVYNDFLKTVELDGSIIINNVMEGISGWTASESAAIFDESGLTNSFVFNYYQNFDDIGRPVNEVRQYEDGTSNFTYTYDDAGNIVETIRSHTSPIGSVNYSMISKFDKGIRNIYNEMDVEGAVLGISDLVFDDREWLQTKTLGGGLQSIAYDYNPRGWLTQINSVESTIPEYEPCDDEGNDQPLCDCLGPYDVHSLDIFYDCLEMATDQPTNVIVNITSSTINGETQSVFDEQTIIIPFNGGTYEEAASYSDNIALDLGGGLGGENGGGNPGQAIDDVLQFILDCIGAAGTEENPDTPGGTFGTLQYAIFDALGIDSDGELPDNPGNGSDANLFGMEIHYFDGNSELNALPQYNGNISWVEWANYREPVQRYGYAYDGANRLLAAKYEAEKIETCEKMFQGVYDAVITSYDDRGNIQGIRRNGITEMVNNSPTFGLIDDLSFTYNGNSNLLDRVDNNAITDYGFASDVSNYTYITGNLHTDSGKKITNMSYNYMDLPLKIDVEGSTVYNKYDANGRKLESKIVSIDPDHESVTYYYMDGIEYKDEELEAVYHSEGRYTFDKEGQNYYEFFLKDHLGNTRVRFADKDNSGKLAIEPLEVAEVGGVELQYQEYLGAKSYYPFGMAFSHNAVTTEDGNLFWVDEEGGVKNRYSYNGKELIDDLDINLHDYGARYYDPAIARWTTIDPLAETNHSLALSPYNYVANNPIRNIDPDGMDRIYYNQKGEEIDRVVEEDMLITFGGMAFKAKVADTYFVSSDQGDVEHGEGNYIQALSRESLFGDADDKKNSSSFFTSLDESTISTTEKARNAVDGKVSDSESVYGFYSNADSKGDYDFKRSILAGDKESDANVNTSYVLRTGNKKWITNRNEAGNYLFGMAAKKVGSPLQLLKLSGHAVEWKNGRMRMDERSEQIMLKSGWKSY